MAAVAWQNMWLKHNPDEVCDTIDERAKIFFVNGTFEQFPAGVRSIVEIQPKDRERPLCPLYIEWLFGVQKEKARLYSKFIDVRTKRSEPNHFYFFRVPGFFTNTLPRPKLSTHRFHPKEFLIDEQDPLTDYDGTRNNTIIPGIAFYYLKIHPSSRRKLVHINRNRIMYDLDDTSPNVIRQFLNDVSEFVHNTPRDVLGISFISYHSRQHSKQNHSTVLVFDSKSKRLEFYDSNGIESSEYVKNPGTDIHAALTSDVVMDLFTKGGIPRVCKVWANTFQLQVRTGDCALWSSVSAICRMSGIKREQLPTKTSDQRAIMSLLREIMWTDCKLSNFGKQTFTRGELDRILHSCEVPADKKEKLWGLVMKHQTKLPLPIPLDHQLCDFEAQPPRCDRLTINLQEVDVDSDYLAYFVSLCTLDHVTVILPDIVTFQIALRDVARAMEHGGTLQLELPDPIDSSDKYIMQVFKTILRNNRTLVIRSGDQRFTFEPSFDLPDEESDSSEMDLDSITPRSPPNQPLGSPTYSSPPPPVLDLALEPPYSPAYSPTAPSDSSPPPPFLDLAWEAPYSSPTAPAPKRYLDNDNTRENRRERSDRGRAHPYRTRTPPRQAFDEQPTARRRYREESRDQRRREQAYTSRSRDEDRRRLERLRREQASRDDDRRRLERLRREQASRDEARRRREQAYTSRSRDEDRRRLDRLRREQASRDEDRRLRREQD